MHGVGLSGARGKDRSSSALLVEKQRLKTSRRQPHHLRRRPALASGMLENCARAPANLPPALRFLCKLALFIFVFYFFLRISLMHQPIRWWTGLVPLALVWILGNFIRTDAIETDLTSRAKAAVATVSANLKDTSSIAVAGRDVILSGAALAPRGSAEAKSAAESTFGVRKVIAALDIAKPVAAVPPPVLEAADCQAELTATLKKDKIQFELASARLAPAAMPLLAEIISIAKRCKSGAIEVAGHTDSSGDPAGNMTLSKARSQSVVDYLVKNAIDRARISATGYGDTRPIAPNTTEDGMAQNRRIEFIVK